MLTNAEIGGATEYHEVTKHSPAGIRTGLHRLDWTNKPALCKVYEGLPRTPLPKGFVSPPMPALEAISSVGGEADLDLATLAQILYFAAGITKKARTHDGTDYLFRAAASAGALYPIEVYLACRDLDGLPAGVYHFAPRDFALHQLRAGDFRSAFMDAGREGDTAPSAILILTAIFWRSAWKYQARSYRYCFWDTGTILANLLATASAGGLRAKVVAGFQDAAVDRLLGIDGNREGSLCLVLLGQDENPPKARQEVPPLDLVTRPLSQEEVDYPPIRTMHHSSYLATPAEVTSWKGSLPRPPREATARTYSLDTQETAGRPLGEVVLRRGSTRLFRRVPIRWDQLSSILHFSTQGFAADFLGGPDTRLVDIYLIVNEVEGLPSGAYSFSSAAGHLELLREGEFRQWAGFLGLEQALPADASADVFFLADLDRVLGRWGNRGYRIAQLEAGILGGRMYLAAYSLGLGATGLTFYDDEIVDFFSPHAEGKDAMFMVALGKAVKARSPVVPVRPPFAGQEG